MNTANPRIGNSRLTVAALCFVIFVLAFASATEVRAQGGPLRIQTNELPSGVVGNTYSFTVNGAGGVTPYAWSASGLPPDLTIGSGSGQITGIPTQADTFSVTVTLKDVTLATVSKSFNLVIGSGTLSVSTTSLSPGTVGQSYSEVLTASGGTPPYSWSIASGSLPGGLTLIPSGSIDGTPTAVGNFIFTVRVTDSASRIATRSLSITISLPLLITTPSPLAAGTVGASYSQTLAATGGTTPYVWTPASGTLPAGLTLSAGGMISGTPTAAGTSNFTVQVTDSGSRKAMKEFSITVNPTPPVITTAAPLPAGTVGTAYSQPLGATGGMTPYTWSVASGTLPPGLMLSADGVISGTPTAQVTATFTVRVTDSASQTATKRSVSDTVRLWLLLVERPRIRGPLCRARHRPD
jgi:hypothetical protein